jgi:hypothetical protein
LGACGFFIDLGDRQLLSEAGAAPDAHGDSGDTGSNSDASDDASGSVPVSCPSAPCPTPAECCFNTAGMVCQVGCGERINCLGSDNCQPGEMCCAIGTVQNQGGQCYVPSMHSTCTTICTGTDTAACTGSAQLTIRLCSTPNDCDSAHPKCCHLGAKNIDLTACASITAAGSLTCL